MDRKNIIAGKLYALRDSSVTEPEPTDGRDGTLTVRITEDLKAKYSEICFNEEVTRTSVIMKCINKVVSTGTTKGIITE